MEYLIQKCKKKNLPELITLCNNHAQYEQVNYNTTGKEKLLKEALFSKRQKLFCYIIQVDNKPQGYFSYTFDYSTWDAQQFLYLDCLYLEPAYRGQGIGKVIFKKLKKIAKQNRCVNIQWQTPIFNERAIQFYHTVGGNRKDKARFFIPIKQKLKTCK